MKLTQTSGDVRHAVWSARASGWRAVCARGLIGVLIGTASPTRGHSEFDAIKRRRALCYNTHRQHFFKVLWCGHRSNFNWNHNLCHGHSCSLVCFKRIVSPPNNSSLFLFIFLISFLLYNVRISSSSSLLGSYAEMGVDDSKIPMWALSSLLKNCK